MQSREVSTIRKPQIAGRYVVERELARGGMGVVYEVSESSTGRRVALKRLLDIAIRNSHVVRLFQREYHTLVQLQHPRIIEVYDYGVDREGAYYTMELLDGKDLRELAPLGYQDACKHLRDVASSLALLHARRLIHRDLSARNVRLTSDGRAKLLDFGALATFGVTGQVVGTPPVVPPEALNGHPLDQRADLFALGALAYWLLTGRHAYPATRLQMLPSLWNQGAPVPPSAIIKGLPQALDELVMSLLSLDVMSRPSSAAEVIERLNVIAGLESEAVLDVKHSYLSNPKIVGREREMDRVRRFVERVVSGHSAAVFIEGEGGVGKTRLVEEATVEGQLRGATVLRADAELARSPYGVARRLAQAMLAALPEIAVPAAESHAEVLAGLLPELREHFRDTKLGEVSADRSEKRVRVQAALADWFLAVAAQKPLVLAVDNLQVADEASVALCAALPRRGQGTAIGVITACRTGESAVAPRTMAAVREAATVVPLIGLGSDDSIALVRALFGDVENAGRLGKWLRDRTDGNPMHCLTLAAQLISEEHVRYKDGAWVLPGELSKEHLPSGMQQVLERRVAQLSEAARRLAQAVSIQQGSFSIEQAAALADVQSDEIYHSLDELVQRGMVVNVGDDYRFAQVVVQKHLFSSLSDQRRRELHLRAGEYALNRADGDYILRIEAGWHLLRAGEEVRGAELLANLGPEVLTSIEGLALAAPGWEAALQVFEKQGRPDWVLLNILDGLTAAGWYVDHRYADKYGERTLDLAMKLSGLDLATKLAPLLGPRLAIPIGTMTAAFKHGIVKRRMDVDRFKRFKDVFVPLIASLSIMIGTAANSFDATRARRTLDKVRVLRFFPPEHIVRVLYNYARYYTYQTEGRLAEAAPIGVRVLEWFQTSAATKLLTPMGAKALAGGQMTGLAMVSAMTGAKEAFEWAKRLEDLGLSFYALMAAQARFVCHVHRGELTRAAPYREQLELNAIQGGTTWQTSILVPFMLGISYSMTGEVVRLRAAAEELEARARDIPSLASAAKVLRAAYHYWRGRPLDALLALEEVSEVLKPGAHALWPVAATIHVRSLTAAGRTEEALALGRSALAELGSADKLASIMLMDLDLSVALAEAELGEVDAAGKRVDVLIESQTPLEVPMALSLLHETRARIALKQSDDPAFQRHVDEMGRWVRATDNTALVAKWKRLELAGRRNIDEREAAISHRGLATISAYASAARVILGQHEGAERARAALRMLIDQSNAVRGYLYLGNPQNLRLVAQYPEDTPPSGSLTEHLVGLAHAVHASTDFLDRSEIATGTMNLTNIGTGAEDPVTYPGDMTAQLLVVSQGGQPKVIGAVALELERDVGEPPGYDLLEAVAESLRGSDARSQTGGAGLPAVGG